MELYRLDLGHIFTEERLKEIEAQEFRPVVSGAKASSSLEPEATAGMNYGVLDGVAIEKRLPWLHSLYNDPSFVSQMSDMAKVKLIPATGKHKAFGVNLNYVSTEQRYEVHTDNTPWTVLVFCTTHEEGEGGDFCYSEGDVPDGVEASAFYREAVHIRPEAGKAILFRGERIAHAVQPFMGKLRVTAPLSYHTEASILKPNEWDDSGYDSYLFGGA